MKDKRIIGLAKEDVSPENPNGSEKRVALLPEQVQEIIKKEGEKILFRVEKGAGNGMGYQDWQYKEAGAEIVDADTLYKESDIVVKFKGPANERISQMKEDAVLLAMLHFGSMPFRKVLLSAAKVDGVSMEHICQAPEQVRDEFAVGYGAFLDCFEKNGTDGKATWVFLGCEDEMEGAIRAASREKTDRVLVMPETASLQDVQNALPAETADNDVHIVYKSELDPALKTGYATHDINAADKEQARKAYGEACPPKAHGARLIENLAMTGEGGAELVKQKLKKQKKELKDASIVVLGSGNVSMGAVSHILKNGGHVTLLGRCHTKKEHIGPFLENADAIINGADLVAKTKADYLITKDQVRNGTIRDGAILCDLISGTRENRSPVQPAKSFTTPAHPSFVKKVGRPLTHVSLLDDFLASVGIIKERCVTVSSVWGLPLVAQNGAQRSAETYSEQIKEILIGDKIRLIDGIQDPVQEELKQALYQGSKEAAPEKTSRFTDKLQEFSSEKCRMM
jgi:alanine dehydrogenase